MTQVSASLCEVWAVHWGCEVREVTHTWLRASTEGHAGEMGKEKPFVVQTTTSWVVRFSGFNVQNTTHLGS